MSSGLIGGLFGLADAGAAAERRSAARPLPGFLSGSFLATVNARSAVAILVEALHPGRVWLPSYLCAALLDGVSRRGVPVAWYPVGEALQPAGLTWLDEVGAGDVVVVIDYFGFIAPDGLMAAARDRGAFLLEDASQALLTSGAGSNADAVVFSPRKFVGVPDGGILGFRSRTLNRPAMVPPPDDWWCLALDAARRRAAFDKGSGDRDWYGPFRRAEDGAPVGPYAMSELSYRLLSGAIDYADVAERRRANYLRLASALTASALFPRLPDEVVPLGFPVRLSGRDRVRQALFAHEIFAPTHWQIETFVPSSFVASHALSSRILTLPCDQRYGEADMDLIASIVTSEEGGT